VEKQVYDNIQFGIEMLLDSESDGAGFQEEGILEKDLDNFNC